MVSVVYCHFLFFICVYVVDFSFIPLFVYVGRLPEMNMHGM
jgi:hypothetical protein